MLLQAFGAGLPAAVAIALSPFPVIGIVVVLAAPRGRSGGVFFAVGWLFGLTAVTLIVALAFGSADDPDSGSAAIADWGRVVVGAGLVATGVNKWRTRPRGGEVASSPSWMASLDTIAPLRAGFLGLGLAGANPKNFVLAAAAATSIAEAGVAGSQLLVAVAIFVLVGSSSVIGAVVVFLVGGVKGAAMLEGVRGFMVANNAVISMLLFLLLGASVLGNGLSGLGR